MHDGNILMNGTVKIVDWGTARLGPAMLDVANIAEHGSPNMSRYLDTRELLDGRRISAQEATLAYRWAEVQINTRYLHYVAEHRPAGELWRMVKSRSRALRAKPT